MNEVLITVLNEIERQITGMTAEAEQQLAELTLRTTRQLNICLAFAWAGFVLALVAAALLLGMRKEGRHGK